MLNYNVGISYENRPIKLFKIGFFSNGFFISNFLGKSDEDLNKNVLAFKAKFHQLKHGISKRKGYLFRRISKIPKYSHHFDGFAQFSLEKQVISGKDEITNKPKGLGTSSFSLEKSNDGGPFAALAIWGPEKLPSFVPNESDVCISGKTMFNNDLIGDRSPNALRIEFFYVLKEGMVNPENSDFLNYFCTVTGPRLIQILPTPETYKGNLCVDICIEAMGFDSEQGFSFSGGPGKMDKQNFCENLVLIYPDPLPEKDLKSLNLNDIDKLQYKNRGNLKKFF